MGQDSAPQPANPYAAPRALLEDAGSVEHELADRRRRLGAAFIDAVLFGLCGMLTGMFGAFGVAVGVLATLGLIAANLWLLNRNGQTIGKYSFDMKIVRTSGEPAGLARIIFLRGLPQWIVGLLPWINVLSLVDVLFIFRADRRCVHDLLADTMVVKTGG